MCVGETLEQRQAGETASVLVAPDARRPRWHRRSAPSFIIAYEPVWAIGTGLAADGAIAQEAIGLIRTTVREIAGAVADDVRILYGGSVTPDNIAEFMAQPDIDGGLVGGASLKADTFAGIIERDGCGGDRARLMPPRLIAIVGATATGKTALAIELAPASRRRDHQRRLAAGLSRHGHRHGQADAPPSEPRARHWLIDVVDPDEPFTLASFLDVAQAALDDIWSRGRLPIVVGGTGQYVWALLEGWTRAARAAPNRALARRARGARRARRRRGRCRASCAHRRRQRRAPSTRRTCGASSARSR